jgi:GT2 family glycosyltransferase
MKLSLIAVCHHSSSVLRRCLASFRREAAVAGLATEIVAVEQSEDDEEAASVAALEPDLVLRRPNRGYAAGLNAGIAEATGDVLLLANPDIVFLDGSVASLTRAVAAGADVVGPQLVWDEAGTVLLPIPDDPHPVAELGRTIRRRRPGGRGIENVARSSWGVWGAGSPVEVPSLRGPLLALARDTARRFGPLDEGYFLYYEETDWLWRARRRGASLKIAPNARVVHRWGHASERRTDRDEIEARSRARFFERSYPRPIRWLLARLSPTGAIDAVGFDPVSGPEAVRADAAELWLVSIVGTMEPAVGCIAGSTLPPAARELTARGRWYAVAARFDGGRWHILGRWTWGPT